MDELQQNGDSHDDEDAGLSLEELSQTYARIMGSGDVPYQDANQVNAVAVPTETVEQFDPLQDELIESDHCPITPQSILEAILFIGRPDNKPILPDEIAALMRGVRTEEITELACELNRLYLQDSHAIQIASTGGGLRMQLADQLSDLRNRFYGKIRESRLSQTAIDCLALIAYQPGITRAMIEQQRGEPSGSVLNQLVRRELIQIRRSGEGKQNRINRYYPTERLLKITGLNSLDELPQVEDWN